MQVGSVSFLIVYQPACVIKCQSPPYGIAVAVLSNQQLGW